MSVCYFLKGERVILDGLSDIQRYQIRLHPCIYAHMYLCKCVSVCVYLRFQGCRQTISGSVLCPLPCLIGQTDQSERGLVGPTTQTLCFLSLSVGRSTWNNNSLLHVPVKTIQELVSERKVPSFIFRQTLHAKYSRLATDMC